MCNANAALTFACLRSFNAFQVVPDIKPPSQRWPRFSNRAYNYSKPVFNARDPLTGFIVVLLEYVEDEHPCNILNRSAGKSVSTKVGLY